MVSKFPPPEWEPGFARQALPITPPISPTSSTSSADEAVTGSPIHAAYEVSGGNHIMPLKTTMSYSLSSSNQRSEARPETRLSMDDPAKMLNVHSELNIDDEDFLGPESSTSSKPYLNHTPEKMPDTPPQEPTSPPLSLSNPFLTPTSTHPTPVPTRHPMAPMFPRFSQPVPKAKPRKSWISYTWQEKVQPGSNERIVVRCRTEGGQSGQRMSKKPNSLLPTDMQPVYPRAHVGDPCRLHSLDHMLDCGHKVITPQPEPCARNCRAHGELGDGEKKADFMCMSCISQHLHDVRARRFLDYKAELEATARQSGKCEEWIAQKLMFVSLGWRDLDLQEIKSTTMGKRACQVFWMDPEHVEMLKTATGIQPDQSRKTPVTSLAKSTAPTSQSSDAVASAKLRPARPGSVSGSLTSSVFKLFKGRDGKEAPLVHDPVTPVRKEELWAAESSPAASSSSSIYSTGTQAKQSLHNRTDSKLSQRPTNRWSSPVLIKPWHEKINLAPSERSIFHNTGEEKV